MAIQTYTRFFRALLLFRVRVEYGTRDRCQVRHCRLLYGKNSRAETPRGRARAVSLASRRNDATIAHNESWVYEFRISPTIVHLPFRANSLVSRRRPSLFSVRVCFSFDSGIVEPAANERSRAR